MLVSSLRLYYGLWSSSRCGDCDGEGSNATNTTNITKPAATTSSYEDTYEGILLVPVCVVLPLLPVLLPVLWAVVNTLNTAIILSLYHEQPATAGEKVSVV